MNIEQTIVQVINDACKRYPEKIAFSGLGQKLTYSDLARLSDDFAAYLQSHTNLEPGDRIAIQLPNILQYPVVVIGALKAGLVVVNTNPLYTPRETEHQFNDAHVKALVVCSLFAQGVAEEVTATSLEYVIIPPPLELGPFLSEPSSRIEPGDQPDFGVPTLCLAEALELGAKATLQPVEKTPDDLAMLQYTGGTTGVSKGAMLTHRNIVANSLQNTTQSSQIFREGIEVTVCPLPLYHIYAFTVHCMAMVTKGCHSILVANPRDLPALLQEIKTFPITGLVGLNTLFNALLANEDFRAMDFSTLKSTTSGGMALTSETARAWQELTGVQIAEGYGLTEASPTVCSNPPGEIKPGTVGKPVPLTEVKLVDENGNDLPLTEIGELCVKGPQVMKGYWNRPEATADVLSEDGWLKTGDMASIDEDGYVKIVDRKKDMIVVSGFNVYPNEIEDIACMSPLVAECAAIGVPDQNTGESVKLFVVPNGEFNEDELKKFMRAQLTAYKMPKQFELIDELPKSNVGKVLRRKLQ